MKNFISEKSSIIETELDKIKELLEDDRLKTPAGEQLINDLFQYEEECLINRLGQLNLEPVIERYGWYSDSFAFYGDMLYTLSPLLFSDTTNILRPYAVDKNKFSIAFILKEVYGAHIHDDCVKECIENTSHNMCKNGHDLYNRINFTSIEAIKERMLLDKIDNLRFVVDDLVTFAIGRGTVLI